MSKLILKNIRTIGLTGAKLNTLIHDTAVLVCEHAIAHGDCSFAQKLVMAMPASHRRSTLISWFGLFSPIVCKDDAKWTSKMHKEGTKLFVPFDVEAGKAKPFYLIAEEVPENNKIYDFAMLLEMAKRLAKTIDKKIDDGKVNADDVASGKALVAALTAIKVQPVKASNDKTDPADAKIVVGKAVKSAPATKPLAIAKAA